MFRSFVLGFLAAIALAIIAGYAVLRAGLIPANADGRALPFEKWAARTSLEAYLGRKAPKEANPVALTDENLIAGIKLYGRHCAFCHGTAQGDASATSVAKSLYPKPPQLASEGVEDDPEGVTFWKIKHGIRWTAMPSWKTTLTDEQIWTLALFLKHLDKLPPAAQAEWAKVQH
ncbi:MAG TPA: cytochrome c [Methylovirgula sp.]|nr:cytochrome c [Methylovirgula sp.]